MTFDILDPRIDTYLKQLNAKHDDPVLLAMEARAEEHDFPIVGRLCGAFLEAMALTIGAKKVFEMGSGYGYSAWWFTRAVGPDGTVWCTDGKAENRDLAEQYLTEAGRWDRVEYAVSWAQEALMVTEGTFDIVYNDVVKDQYPDTWLLAKDRVRPGGLYICDNVLWSGRVTDEGYDASDSSEAIRRHNELVFADSEFDAFILPVRDGVLVARRR
ncbi:MAG: O-methyltransferase [Thermomicrobiales bacterium]|nr:O-methyltransferase [Thermomicrobiales bacterium]